MWIAAVIGLDGMHRLQNVQQAADKKDAVAKAVMIFAGLVRSRGGNVMDGAPASAVELALTADHEYEDMGITVAIAKVS